MLRRSLITTALFLYSVSLPGAYIAYQGEIHTGNNNIAFFNLTASTQKIERIRIYIGDRAYFDVNGIVEGTEAEINPVLTTSSTFTMPIAHWGFTADDSSTDVGLVNAIGTYFTHGSQLVDLYFTDFNPGEAWGIRVDIDGITTSGGYAAIATSGFLANLLIEVFYEGGWVLTSSCNDPYYVARGSTGGACLAPGSGGGRSFPSYNYATVTSSVPEPAHGLAVGALALGLAWRARHQRKTGSPQAPRS
jgi:hypothetical protein